MTIERRDFSQEEFQEASEWLQKGIDKGWISEGFCYTHDGDPYMTAEEEQEWEDGGDPCNPVIKWLL
jgi:hypothetical protein